MRERERERERERALVGCVVQLDEREDRGACPGSCITNAFTNSMLTTFIAFRCTNSWMDSVQVRVLKLTWRVTLGVLTVTFTHTTLLALALALALVRTGTSWMNGVRSKAMTHARVAEDYACWVNASSGVGTGCTRGMNGNYWSFNSGPPALLSWALGIYPCVNVYF